MTKQTQLGRVHSLQSMGTLDGPGVRFVVFLQGCPLRCHCCHNPDTWALDGGTPYSPDELVSRALRFREYFGDKGGVTVSGGEPLLQAAFVHQFFSLCHEQGLHTCLDTSGCLLTDEICSLLDVTDRVLLDIKYTRDEDYRAYVGTSLYGPLAFLDLLCRKQIPTTLRQVIIPTVNDTEDSVLSLKQLAETHPNVDNVELLPFRKLCQVKYDTMGIPFPFGHLNEPTGACMAHLQNLLSGR